MSKSAWLNPRSTLTGLTALCVMFALLPARWGQWAGSLHGPVVTLLAPVQGPVRWLSVRLRGPEKPESSSEQVKQLEQNYADAVQQLLQSRRQVEDMRQTIRELSQGVDLMPDVKIRQVPGVTVIGPGADSGSLVSIKAGKTQGIDESGVAVVRGVHLVGRVRTVTELRAGVQPMTDKGIGLIDAVVTSDDLRFVAECQLEPDGRGLLIGRVRDSTDPNAGVTPASLIAPGMTVRVRDASWPAASQMLILGRVERVEPLPEMALRSRVIVRPDFTLARAAEVTIRMVDTGFRPAPPSTGGRP